MPVNVDSASEIEREFREMAVVISDDRTYDWERRVESLVQLRGMVAGNAVGYDNFVPDLRILRVRKCLVNRVVSSSAHTPL